VEQLYRWYVLGHWHISLCAVFLFVGATWLSGGGPSPESTLLIFSATLFVYTLHRYVSADRMVDTDQQRYSFVSDHRYYALTILILSAIIAGVTFFRIDRALQLSIVLLGVISITYILPILFSKRLRDMGILKIILISLVWGSLPIIGHVKILSWPSSGLIFLENFCFIFALTIPFDVRDAALDERAKVSNLTNLWSINRLKVTMLLCMLVASVASVLLYVSGIYSLALVTSIIALGVLQVSVTHDLNKARGEHFYLLYLDGFILIKGLIYFCLSRYN